jgi:hypothetical protein
MSNEQPQRVRRKVVARAVPPPSKRWRAGKIAGIVLLSLLVATLAYGFLQHSILHPRVDATIERTDLFVKAGEHIQVNVVNACGVTGMAGKFTEFLRARKFDVPEYSTSKTTEAHSKVIDRVGDTLSARKVAYALGIATERIETEIDSSLFLRATVVIGQDYQALRPMK